MVDKEARAKMAAALRAYMADQMDSVELDDAIGNIPFAAEDETIGLIYFSLLGHFDADSSHPVVASREQWDYFNRLLLVLESDSELEVMNRRWRWRTSHVCAAVCLAALLVAAAATGFKGHLTDYTIPLGIAALAISYAATHELRRAALEQTPVASPFASVRALRRARRRAGHFFKTPYPKSLEGRRAHGRVYEWATWLYGMIQWFMVSPVIVFIQALPRREKEIRVVTPGAGPGEVLTFLGDDLSCPLRSPWRRRT